MLFAHVLASAVRGESEDVAVKAVVVFNGSITINDIHTANTKKCGVIDFIVTRDVVVTL